MINVNFSWLKDLSSRGRGKRSEPDEGGKERKKKSPKKPCYLTSTSGGGEGNKEKEMQKREGDRKERLKRSTVNGIIRQGTGTIIHKTRGAGKRTSLIIKNKAHRIRPNHT